MRSAITFLLSLFALSACSSPPKAIEPAPANTTAQKPTVDEDEYISPRSPTVFDADLWKAIEGYKGWNKVDPNPRMAPELCRAMVAPRGPMEGDISKSEDAATHGRKVYLAYAKDTAAYLGMRPGDEAAVGQVIVKDAWVAEKVTAEGTLPEGAPTAAVGSERYWGKAPTSLYVMVKLDPDTPDTDAGWIYGVTTPDRKDIAQVGALSQCMDCHAKAPHDRLFGTIPSLKGLGPFK